LKDGFQIYIVVWVSFSLILWFLHILSFNFQ
jgi:hypothetical protein